MADPFENSPPQPPKPPPSAALETERDAQQVEHIGDSTDHIIMSPLGDISSPSGEYGRQEVKTGCCDEGCDVWWAQCPHRMFNWIPKPLLSWKRWLVFIGLFSVLLLVFAFIPTDPSIIDPIDPPEVHWKSMVPPLLCISLATAFGLIILSLFMGVFVGGLIAFNGNPYLPFQEFIFKSIWDPFNAYILGFTVVVVGLILLMRRSNGLDSMLHLVSSVAKTAWATRIATAFGCLLFFFDDYSNCVISGTMWRNLYDKLQMSRAKLAYIVDSTAAPMASVALISTWISYELGIIEEAINQLNQDNEAIGAEITWGSYEVFLQKLGMRYYCWTSLISVFTCVVSNRDYGPMLAAERRRALWSEPVEEIEDSLHDTDDVKAQAEGSTPQSLPSPHSSRSPHSPQPPHSPQHQYDEHGRIDKSKPHPNAPLDRWHLAVIPLLCLLFGTMIGMFLDGLPAVIDEGEDPWIWNGAAWRIAFGAAFSSFVLFWCAVAVTSLTLVMVIYYEAVQCEEAVNAFFFAVPTMLEPCIILVLAWAIKEACTELNTANYIVSILGSVDISYMPSIIFLLAVVTALCTGTSWGAMGIILPIALSIVYTIADKDPSTPSGLTPTDQVTWLLTASAVLDGAVMGDHISPISDTTVLSATSAGCDLLDHVKTQLPYALVTGVTALLVGYLPAGLGMPYWIYYLIAAPIIISVFMIVGSWLPSPQDPSTPIDERVDTGKPSLVNRLCTMCNCGACCEPACVACGCHDPVIAEKD